MLRWLVNLSLKFHHLLLLIGVVVALLGASQLSRHPVDLLPEFSPPRVEVQTEALGLAPAEVEALISAPMEEILAGIPWLEQMHSTSVAGLSSIEMVFKPGTDLMSARQLVQERLLHTSVLPKVAKSPTMLMPVASLGRTMQVGLTSNTLSLIDLSILARWKVKPRLMSVPGVANVSIWGQRERQLQVLVDPDKMLEKGVNLNDVIKATGNALYTSSLTFLRASTPGAGGFIDTPTQRYDIRHVLPISSPEHLARITFPAADGSTLRLSDVASVIEGHQPLIGDAIVNDAPGLMLVVEKLPGANTVEVTQGIERALEALKPGLPEVNISATIYRPASFIEESVGNIARMLLIGGLLAAVALVLSLRNWRTAVVSAVVIPISLLATWIVLMLLGTTINTMILVGFGVALAAVIDDAITNVVQIQRRLEERASGADASLTILGASLEVGRPLVQATAIIALAAVPVLLVSGTVGALLQPVVLSCALALLASIVVAQMITPALCLLVMGQTPPNTTHEMRSGWLVGSYRRVLSRLLTSPRPALIGICGLALLGLAAVPFVGGSIVPTFRDRDLLVQWTTAPGTSHPEMTRMLSEATRKLRSVPGVREVAGHIGRAVQSDTVANVNTADVWVSLAPEADYDTTLASVRRTLDAFPGTRTAPVPYATAKLGQALDHSDESVKIQIFGPDWKVLQNKAEEVRQAISTIPGVVAPHIPSRNEEPSVEIEVNLAAAERHGLKPGDVRRATATLVAGIEAGSLYEEQKIFEVVVWGKPELRRDVASIGSLMIEKPGGGHVRLSEIADVRIKPNFSAVSRQNASRYVDVVAHVRGRDLDAVVSDVNQHLRTITFPREYHPEVQEPAGERHDAFGRLLGYGIAAALGIFFLLLASVGDWRVAGIAYLMLPISLVGGVLAVLATGSSLSIGALAGVMAILLITARHGILLIHRFQYLERNRYETFGPDLVLRGAEERLTPALTTSVVTVAALLPLLALGQAPGLEILQPMAAFVIGGLVTSMLLTLLVLPSLYLLLGARTREQVEIKHDTSVPRGVRHAAE